MQLSVKLMSWITLTVFVGAFGVGSHTNVLDHYFSEYTDISDQHNTDQVLSPKQNTTALDHDIFPLNSQSRRENSHQPEIYLSDSDHHSLGLPIAGIDGTGGQPKPNSGIDGTGGQPGSDSGIDGTGGLDTDSAIDGSGGPVESPKPPKRSRPLVATSVLGTLRHHDGRLLVNGTLFETNDETKTTINTIENAKPSDLNDGETVLIHGGVYKSDTETSTATKEGVAEQIIYTTRISGAITYISGNFIVVLQQNIHLHPDVVFGGSAEAITDLQIGDTVNVSGFEDANGGFEAIRIDRVPAGDDKITGTISELNELDKTFLINKLTVRYDQVTPLSLSDGLTVNIIGEVDTEAPNVLQASSIVLAESILDTNAQYLEVEGLITDKIDQFHFKIGDVTVYADQQVHYVGNDYDDLDVNIKVEVEGRINPETNTLIAERIVFLVARFISHEQNSNISSSSEVFEWNDVNAEAYRLRIFQDGNDRGVFYDEVLSGDVTSVEIPGLPVNSAIFVANLHTLQNGFWSLRVNRFKGTGEVLGAVLTSHDYSEKDENGNAVFKSDKEILSWNEVEGAEEYRIRVFDGPTNESYYDETFNSAGSTEEIDLPNNYADVNVGIYTRVNGWWVVNYYDFKSVKVFENTALTSHVDRQKLTGTTQTNTWNDVGAKRYSLRIARRMPEGSFQTLQEEIYDGSTTSVTIHNLPENNGEVLIRLRTEHDGWASVNYTFTGVGDASEATLTSHENKDVLTSSVTEFEWDPSAGAEEYRIGIQNTTTAYEEKVTEDFSGNSTKGVLSNLPRNGAEVQLRLSTNHGGYWGHKYYRLLGTGELPDAKVTSHVDREVITDSSMTLTWNNVNADAYRVSVVDTTTNNRSTTLHDEFYEPQTTSLTLENLPKDAVLKVYIITRHGEWWAREIIHLVTDIP